MKTLLLALATGAMVLLGTTPNAEARHSHHGGRTFVSSYNRCGCPVYATRYVAFHNRWGQPVWRTRYIPVNHRCHRGYGYHPPRNYGYYNSGYYAPRHYRGGYYNRPGITIRF